MWVETRPIFSIGWQVLLGRAIWNEWTGTFIETPPLNLDIIGVEMESKPPKKRISAKALVCFLGISGAVASAALTTPAIAGLEQLQAGVQLASEVIKLYQGLNPPQSGYVNVINATSSTITVRSYNTHDWAKLIAAGQLNLKPGAQGAITAATDPVSLLWKRGNYNTLKPFGLDVNQSVAPKGAQYVFVINDTNTR